MAALVAAEAESMLVVYSNASTNASGKGKCPRMNWKDAVFSVFFGVRDTKTKQVMRFRCGLCKQAYPPVNDKPFANDEDVEAYMKHYSALSRHLKERHPGLYNEMDAILTSHRSKPLFQNWEKLADVKDRHVRRLTQLLSSQRYIDFPSSKRFKGGNDQTNRDFGTLLFFVAKGIPLVNLSDPYFRGMTQSIAGCSCEGDNECHRCRIMRRTAATDRLDLLDVSVFQCIKKHLQGCVAVSITMDGWKDAKDKKYLAVTGHWIDYDWELYCAVLGVEEIIGRATAQVIKETADGIVKRYQEGLDFILTTATTDSEAAMVKAAVMLLEGRDSSECITGHDEIGSEVDSGDDDSDNGGGDSVKEDGGGGNAEEGDGMGDERERVACLAHKVQLCVHDVLPGNHKLMTKLRTVINTFRRSSYLAAALRNCCRRNLDAYERLLNPTKTRWSSEYYAINRFLAIQNSVSEVMMAHADAQFEDLMFTDDEWSMLHVWRDVFEVCEKVTRQCEGERYVSISHVAMWTYQLLEGTKPTVSDSRKKRRLRQDLHSAMKKRLLPMLVVRECAKTREELEGAYDGHFESRYVHPSGVEVEYCVLAAALHPEYFALDFLTLEQRKLVWSRIRFEAKDMYLRQWPVQAAVSNPSVNVMTSMGLDDDYEIEGEWADIQRIENDIKQELRRLGKALESARNRFEETDEHCDVLEFWCSLRKELPILEIVARCVLAVPASSAPSERVFSSCGFVDDRSRGASDRVGQIAFCRSGLKFLGETAWEQRSELIHMYERQLNQDDLAKEQTFATMGTEVRAATGLEEDDMMPAGE